MPLRTAWKNLSLLLLTTLICLLLAEIILRVYLPPNTTIYALDDRLLYRLIPNAGKVYVHHKNNGGGKIQVHVNGAGFRDYELAPKKPNLRRIVVYGDSFIEAEFTPLELTFSKQLEKTLTSEAGQALEVVNAGVVGYGPDQISLKIETELHALNPDLVVVAIFAGNDFGDLLRNKIYKLDADGKLVTNDYRIGNALRREFRKPNPSRVLSETNRAVRRLFPPRSDPSANELTQPATYIKRSLDRCRNDYEDYRKSSEVKNPFRDQYDADVSLEPDSESAQYKVRLMDRVLQRIKHMLAARDTPLVVLLIPTVADLCSSSEISVIKSDFGNYKPSALTDALADIASRNEIAYLNLFDAFQASEPCHLYFRYPNAHWNEEGQRLAAILASDYLMKSSLLQGRIAHTNQP